MASVAFCELSVSFLTDSGMEYSLCQTPGGEPDLLKHFLVTPRAPNAQGDTGDQHQPNSGCEEELLCVCFTLVMSTP